MKAKLKSKFLSPGWLKDNFCHLK